MLTDVDMEDIISSNQSNIISWLDNIVNNTGEFGENISTMIEGAGVDEPYDNQDEYPDDYTDVSFEDTYLTVEDYKVQMTGSIEGFAPYYTSDGYYFTMGTDESSYASFYGYGSYETPEDILSYADMPSEENGDEVYEISENQQITISDGSTVYYSYAYYDYYGYKIKMYSLVKEFEPGIYVNADVYIYDEDANSAMYTLEQVAEMLNDSYFQIIAE